MQKTIDEYIEALKNYKRLTPDLVYHKVIPGKKPIHGVPAKPWPQAIDAMLDDFGITQLFRHQVEAIDLVREGQHVVVATPTASGKTLTYNLPVLEHIHLNPATRALYLFPLKALAQDQLKTVVTLLSLNNAFKNVTAKIYDGDTTHWERTKIRRNPPNLLFTNPEMLHLSLLPYHHAWETFFGQLKYVIVDEVHTYRGVLGSHMAWVFRRLLRICRYYHAQPVFIFCSATINNPQALTEDLSGLRVKAVLKSDSPTAKKHFVLLNGIEGAAQTAILLLHAALHRNLRTIVYTQSRKMTELIAVWASQKAGGFADKISAYRAGFLPEERREIESKLARGELLAVVSTSALELGIDIGALDLCILVGYPGTMMATWQRAGRVGRRDRTSAVVMIGQEDALDQFFMNHPEALFNMPPENAMINPHNPVIMAKHLVCAAADVPLHATEDFLTPPPVPKALKKLENKGRLLRSEEGDLLYAAEKYPHRQISLRGTGDGITIYRGTGEAHLKKNENIGQIDYFRAFHETHPGAIYLHRGRTFLIHTLDLATKSVFASPAEVNYFTRAKTEKTTEILDIQQKAQVWSTRVYLGRLKVTEKVTGYEKRLVHGQRSLGEFPLDLPPIVFETSGIWIEIPESVRNAVEGKAFHFMGGIHAMEHTLIGILPLIVMTDRNDLGGISIPYHDQVGGAAVFVYDGFPGGIGLCAQAFIKITDVLDRTLDIIAACPCEEGCPACVHSPKCGSGNKPISKHAAHYILATIKNTPKRAPDSDPGQQSSIKPVYVKESRETAPPILPLKKNPSKTLHYGVLDLETQRSAQEVGGWKNAHKMGISCVVVYDSQKDEFRDYLESDIPKLLTHLQTFDLLVGFNIIRFDYQVLQGYSDFDFASLTTLDILQEIYKKLSYRISLNHLAQVTLGTPKSGDGLLALKWWQEGKIMEIIEYCRQDVKVTRDLYLFGREKGYLLFKNKAKQVVRIPMNWIFDKT